MLVELIRSTILHMIAYRTAHPDDYSRLWKMEVQITQVNLNLKIFES